VGHGSARGWLGLDERDTSLVANLSHLEGDLAVSGACRFQGIIDCAMGIGGVLLHTGLKITSV
jgi:hypothetical protein